MNSARRKGFIILLTPLIGLAAIFRGGEPRWMVVPFSPLLSLVCRVGWVFSLVVGVLVVCGRCPGIRDTNRGRDSQ